MSIRCVNKNEEGEYMGRGSPLGNPFFMKNESMREEVCNNFHSYFVEKVNNNDPIITKELERLIELWINKRTLNLRCFCSPLRCHTNSIKEYLVWELSNRGFKLES